MIAQCFSIQIYHVGFTSVLFVDDGSYNLQLQHKQLLTTTPCSLQKDHSIHISHYTCTSLGNRKTGDCARKWHLLGFTKLKVIQRSRPHKWAQLCQPWSILVNLWKFRPKFIPIQCFHGHETAFWKHKLFLNKTAVKCIQVLVCTGENYSVWPTKYRIQET